MYGLLYKTTGNRAAKLPNNLLKGIFIAKHTLQNDRAWFLYCFNQSNQLTTMKKLNLILLTAVLMTLSSCSVITGIFKAGAYTAIIGIVIFIAIIIWVMSLFKGK